MLRREFLGRLALASALLWELRAAETFGADASTAGEAKLAADDIEFLAAATEGIIPATDTPGAIGAGVPEFLAMLFAEWFTPAEQASFASGVRAANEEALTRHGKPFARCAPAEQLELLRKWDQAALRAPHEGPRPFFRQLKSLTLVGYYTSEVGQDVELKVQFGAGAELPAGPVTAPPPFAL